MKSPNISTWLPILTILPFPTTITSLTLPQSPNISAIDPSPSNPTTPLLAPPHHYSSPSSFFIIPPSTSSPDATASYLITFTPTSTTPPHPLPPDGINYCFSRLRILASRFEPPWEPLRRQLACRLADAVVVVVPVTVSAVSHSEVGYLLGQVVGRMAHSGEGEEEGWYGEGVQRWYKTGSSMEMLEVVEVVLGRPADAGEVAVMRGRGVG